MNKYIINIVTSDGSKLEWSADNEKSKDDMLETIMSRKGYIEATNDYGVLYINREQIVAVEVHKL